MSADGRGAEQPGPVTFQIDLTGVLKLDDLGQRLADIEPALLLIFGARGPELETLSRDLRAILPKDCRIAGCSTAGEIGPQGYATDCAVIVAFPKRTFRAATLVLRDLAQLPVSEWMSSLRRLHTSFAPNPNRALFGILLSDGLAGQEDVLVSTVEAALPAVRVLGGSAGDGMDFGRTTLIVDEQVQSGVGIFILVETELMISQVTFAHFSDTRFRLVVTSAVPEKRVILELNAEPAAQEYARLTGIPMDTLTPTEFARHPLMFRSGKHHHVRAIRGITPEGGLSLLSSVDAGMVLTLGRAEDLTLGFVEAIEALPRAPIMVLGFDCILRRLALEQAGMTDQMSELFARYRVSGFSTYGEQHSGMHVNQTFVGLAFMAKQGAMTEGLNAAE